MVEVEVASPGAAPRRFSLVRERISYAGVEGKVLDGGLVYVRPREFNKETPEAVRAILLKHGRGEAKGILLDLRNQGGGRTDAMAEVAGFFLPRGRVLWLQETAGGLREIQNPVDSLTDLPLVVLVDRQTKGSELIAAAIQRNQRGTVVGQRTAGSRPRNLIKNLDGTSRLVPWGALLIRPGQPISGVGVAPDKVLPESASDEDFFQVARQCLATAGKAPPTERLKQVKELYDKGLINKDQYDKKVKEIMDSL
jgi:carboxyl-terminal processing protease